MADTPQPCNADAAFPSTRPGCLFAVAVILLGIAAISPLTERAGRPSHVAWAAAPPAASAAAPPAASAADGPSTPAQADDKPPSDKLPLLVLRRYPPNERYPADTAAGTLAVRVIRDVDYTAPDPIQPNKNQLDLFVPLAPNAPAPAGKAPLEQPAAPPWPVLVFVHGGSWSAGDRDGMIFRGLGPGYSPLGRALAARGILTAVISYRLSPLARHPQHIQDVAAAIAWVHANAAAHQGRPDALFVAGHSAGGHLVALACTDPTWLAAHNLDPRRHIRGLIGLSGAYEINEFIGFDLIFPRGTQARRAASPLHHAQALTAPIPPTLLLYAEKEMTLLVGVETQFANALEKTATPVRLVKVPGRTHIGMVAKFASPGDPVLAEVVAFVKAQSAAQVPAAPAPVVPAVP